MIELVSYVIFAIVMSIAIYIALQLRFAFKNFKIKKFVSGPTMLSDMPSVSVCIPARNEVHAMTDCLERVIASNYPKLEIIVLDDSSVDDTSVLIKSFAHAGVRFVEGSPLPSGWFGKNHALQGLLEEASGSYILYMDVDTHIEPDTIEQLVAYALQEKALMVSVLPRREDGWRTSIVFGTLRYYWELILHRRSNPAVASSAWMIHRKTLKDKIGGFEAYKNVIQPEAKLATVLMLQHSYRFIISTSQLGVAYEKKWHSQIETSVRLLFPVLGGRVLNAGLAVIILLILTLPPFVILASLITGWGAFGNQAVAILFTYMLLYGLYLRHVWDKLWWLGAILWPVIIIQELIILFMSIYQYLRHTVTWKGRPVTAPHQR